MMRNILKILSKAKDAKNYFKLTLYAFEPESTTLFQCFLDNSFSQPLKGWIYLKNKIKWDIWEKPSSKASSYRHRKPEVEAFNRVLFRIIVGTLKYCNSKGGGGSFTIDVQELCHFTAIMVFPRSIDAHVNDVLQHKYFYFNFFSQ